MVCHTIGEVVVHKGNPPEGNPYLGGVWGGCRVEALRKFKYGEDTEGLTFWYAPWGGDARQCTREEVNWASSGIV